MNWWEVAAIVLFAIGFLAMGAVLAVRLYRNPFLLTSLLPVIWRELKPPFDRYVLPHLIRLWARYDAETESAWRDCQRRGGRWNAVKKKCE
jgi:hypothetical protein